MSSTSDHNSSLKFRTSHRHDQSSDDDDYTYPAVMTVVITRKDIAYSLVIIWALAGIIVKQTENQRIVKVISKAQESDNICTL